jgi:hypothetical protein
MAACKLGFGLIAIDYRGESVSFMKGGVNNQVALDNGSAWVDSCFSSDLC